MWVLRRFPAFRKPTSPPKGTPHAEQEARSSQSSRPTIQVSSLCASLNCGAARLVLFATSNRPSIPLQARFVPYGLADFNEAATRASPLQRLPNSSIAIGSCEKERSPPNQGAGILRYNPFLNVVPRHQRPGSPFGSW